MKKVCMLLSLLFAGTLAAVNFPGAGGDFASNGEDGWNGIMPSSSETAQFNQSGTYTASRDVSFASMVVQANSTFNLHGSGNRTVTLGSFTMGYYSRSTTLNGGVYDMSLGSVSAQDTPIGIFSACNQQGTYNTVVTLAKGCIVTNASNIRIAYNTRDNKLKITDGSKVYAKGVNLSVNYGSVRGLLEVSGGSELRVLEGNFLDCGASTSDYLVLADTTNRIVVAGAGSKIVCPSTLVSNDPRGFVIGNIYGKN